ncbi:MAG: hypothetical protein K8F34_02670 [Candidatus Kuenenia stuttgartiensis]|nr:MULTISPECIES: hypothetical protein [Kuenenia]MBZ0190580.1 hypothetical protein [Candidatus Kuenenia stuttgartiensis]MCL4726385.1 hypothetical protein [Candidatus Kuenenia stuttgartiensis]MCZ7623830.1 hypothetical protein [Candidatus Kuenenia sp.]GJQ51116.1 MAG: hypothetical protein HKUEN01_35020 [Candidatus Kuenenia stuttgartiensis]
MEEKGIGTGEEACPQKRGIVRTDGGTRCAKKKSWGKLKGIWVAHDTRDIVVDFVNRWSGKAEIPVCQLIRWIGISQSKFNEWRTRYGKVNEHNAWIPRDTWLEEWEKEAILAYYEEYPLEGYRRLTFMMLDANIVAVSPSSVYRVLVNAGVMREWNRKPSKKGTGFVQPLIPYEHWHIDVSYLNIGGTFYYLCAVLDGYSRQIVHWEIRETMKETEVEIIKAGKYSSLLPSKPARRPTNCGGICRALQHETIT